MGVGRQGLTWGGGLGREGGPPLGFWGVGLTSCRCAGLGSTSGSGDEVTDDRVSGGGWLPTSIGGRTRSHLW